MLEGFWGLQGLGLRPRCLGILGLRFEKTWSLEDWKFRALGLRVSRVTVSILGFHGLSHFLRFCGYHTTACVVVIWDPKFSQTVNPKPETHKNPNPKPQTPKTCKP